MDDDDDLRGGGVGGNSNEDAGIGTGIIPTTRTSSESASFSYSAGSGGGGLLLLFADALQQPPPEEVIQQQDKEQEENDGSTTISGEREGDGNGQQKRRQQRRRKKVWEEKLRNAANLANNNNQASSGKKNTPEVVVGGSGTTTAQQQQHQEDEATTTTTTKDATTKDATTKDTTTGTEVDSSFEAADIDEGQQQQEDQSSTYYSSTRAERSRREERRHAREERAERRRKNREEFIEQQKQKREQQEDNERQQKQQREEDYNDESDDDNNFWELLNKTKSAYNAVFFSSSSQYYPRDVVDGLVNAIQSLIVGATLASTALVVFPAALVAHCYYDEDSNKDHLEEEEEESTSNSPSESAASASSTLESSQGNSLRNRRRTTKVLMGFFGGSILGGAVGTATALLSVVHASHQLITGILATPSATIARWNGMQWDPFSQSWNVYNLQNEYDEVLKKSTRTTGSGSSIHAVLDGSFYELLEVRTDASTKDIKKSYRKLSLRCHPDKNPDDDDAANKFIRLTTAYRTLVDDDLRAAYDEQGYSSADDGGAQFNVHVFFEILFGSQLVEPYVGVLTVSSVVGQLMALYRSPTPTTPSFELFHMLRDDSSHKQRKRQTEIAVNILNRIGNETSASASAQGSFGASFREEAERIAETTGFGDTFLVAIGTKLRLESELYLTWSRWNLIRWLYLSLVKKKRSIVLAVRSTYKILELVWNVSRHAQDIPAEDGPEPNSATEETDHGHGSAKENKGKRKKKRRLTAGTIKKLLPEIMDVAWASNLRDIDSTLDGACRRLFSDEGAGSTAERVKRAETVKMLGYEFLRIGLASNNYNDSCVEEEAREKDAAARVEVAFRVAQMQMDGQKMTSEESEEMIKLKRQAT